MVWLRSDNGIFFGVCEGLGESFRVEPWLLRFLLIFSTFFFFSGSLLYLCLAFTLPRKDQVMESREAKILGVCYRLSHHSNMELGLIRFLFLFIALLSGGSAVLFYLVLHFLLKPFDDDITI